MIPFAEVMQLGIRLDSAWRRSICISSRSRKFGIDWASVAGHGSCGQSRIACLANSAANISRNLLALPQFAGSAGDPDTIYTQINCRRQVPVQGTPWHRGIRKLWPSSAHVVSYNDAPKLAMGNYRPHPGRTSRSRQRPARTVPSSGGQDCRLVRFTIARRFVRILVQIFEAARSRRRQLRDDVP